MVEVSAAGSQVLPGAALAAEDVLCPTGWCVLREQPSEYVAYNSRTDELHLLTPSARYAYLLCDGLNTVRDIEGLLDPGGDGVAVSRLLGGLLERGLLAPAPTAASADRQAGGTR